MKTRLVWHIYPPYLILVIVAMAAAAVYASRTFRQFHYSMTEERMQASARLAAEQVGTLEGQLTADIVDPLCDTLGKASGYRITVVLNSGTVVGDSEEDPLSMGDHSGRPEITDALTTGRGVNIRYSTTLKQNMMYVAVPLNIDGSATASIRASLPLTAIDAVIRSMQLRLITAGLAIIAIATVVAWVISRRISAPLDEIRKGAELFGRGRLDEALPPSEIMEIDVLANSFNTMARQLSKRISTVTEQRDEQNALFAGMIEGVLAVDNQQRVVKLNASAAKMFGIDQDSAGGWNITRIIENENLHDIVNQSLASDEPVEGSVYLADSDRHLQAHGTVLRGVGGERFGALIVLNDITRLKKLEVMRSDFVANVSHELKTPITSIKGFAETLLDGAADNKDDLDRFLNIVVKQSDRLQTILDDLLTLSSLEHSSDQNEIEFQNGNLKQVLESAAQSCMPAAQEKDIGISTECPGALEARMSIQLLEQAVTNLIDNAVKYAGPESKVTVTAEESDHDIIISISDTGPGIESDHLERIFERFYRVDRSRSRKLGGTGLGLAIVKRIAIAHGGRVTVESTPGSGSTFTISLPASRA